MVDRGQENNIAATTPDLSLKKKELLSSAMKRTSEWIFSQEIPSDVIVQVGEASFSLHKFPLVSKCGYIRKLVSESNDADVSLIELSDVPGGAEGFELAAKFCYGINFEITVENIAMLRCMAEYLEMTEDYAVGNLVGRTDAYLNEVALKTISGAVSILHMSEKLLPVAEKAKLVSKCIDAIAYIACKESQFCTSSARSDSGSDGVVSHHQRPVVDWWSEDLTVLRIDIFQRVLTAMMARGFKQYAIGPILMLYAQKSLRGLDIFAKGRKKIEPRQEHEKRVVLETIVSLLPREKNAMSVSFLSMLLRSAIYLETTVACRLDLEKRMAMQLGHAVLDDLLIPAYSFTGDTLFDVDTVQRIMTNYLESHLGNHLVYNQDVEYFSPPQTDVERVGKLMENYLSEIATDRNLTIAKFTNLAELIPEQSKPTEDGMYRAIDIYLKAHPNLSDMERKKVCGVMDCQKLSREACAHAAQNDRLPVQTVVQVLYYEQQRLRDAMNNGSSASGESPSSGQSKTSVFHHPVSNELSTLRRENQDLKLELVKLKMKLKEIENSTLIKSGISSPMISASPSSAADKPPLPRKSFISSVSKKLGKLSPFLRADGIAPFSKGRTKPNKNRRHSIS
ncbi:BTB/POZ domain-containing protein SR1IP1 [Arachis duranensis]|uniref:BTB/POZ domain-containing protein SR1IP1 n=1 Tax=Arachis duranensis TaxID=130453 RepID=A0A6P4DF85_ARADU|nr:BTB/POZ domain-containing protein SR1IP1 [Arachis duranensis]XP_015963850.1 BTB/POZ domain-containing protein SR1IP1 [Arachis duranensis]XP_015963851.1 BTB/POZ domain-containing protein SR1IP1 [Arachis duranensis]